MLTNERAEQIANYLTADKERAQALLVLSPEEAATKINASGYDFTADEIQEFGQNLKAVAKGGELDENDLDDVSGGVVISAAAAGVYLTCVSIGVTLGIAAGSNWKW